MESTETKAPEVEMGLATAAQPLSGPHYHNGVRFAANDDEAAAAAASPSSSPARAHPRGPQHPPRPPKLLPSFTRPAELNLPSGVASFDQFISLFCSVLAVALTLLATGLPLQVKRTNGFGEGCVCSVSKVYYWP